MAKLYELLAVAKSDPKKFEEMLASPEADSLSSAELDALKKLSGDEVKTLIEGIEVASARTGAGPNACHACKE